MEILPLLSIALEVLIAVLAIVAAVRGRRYMIQLREKTIKLAQN